MSHVIYVLHRLTLPDQTWESYQSCYSAELQKTFKMHDQLQLSKYFYTLSSASVRRCELENWLQDPILQNLFPVNPQHTYAVKSIVNNFHNPPTIDFRTKMPFPFRAYNTWQTKQDLKAHSPTFRSVVADPTLLQWADLYDCKARSFKKLNSISPRFHQLSATSLKELSEVKFDTKRLDIHVYHQIR